MSAFRAAASAFRGTGQDAFIGVVGGFLGMPTGAPSVVGGVAEAAGMAARMKVDMIASGAHYATNQRVARLSHYAATGQGSAASTAAARAAIAAGARGTGGASSVAAAAAAASASARA